MKESIYIDKALSERLHKVMPGRTLESLIAEMMMEKIKDLENLQIIYEMREGYEATRDDRAELNRDWDVADMERWPE